MGCTMKMMTPEDDGDDIYQRIWPADVTLGAGIRAIGPFELRNETEEYVVVGEHTDMSNPGEFFLGSHPS